MFKFLMSLKGNTKTTVLTEPLWGIPFQLYAPFVTLYMYHLGIMDIQIGLILTIGRLVMVPMTLIAGVLTDRFGRRMTTLVGDTIAWSIPTLMWAFSQNFWWFLTGIVINALWQITAVSWECLWVDDIDEKILGPVYNLIYISGVLSVFFAPIAGYLVHIYGVVPVMSGLYLFASVSMTAKFVLMYIFTTETKRGVERMAVTKTLTVAQMFGGYWGVLKQIFKSSAMVQALILSAIAGIFGLIINTFFALYATQNLNIPEAFMAYFPILRAGIMLFFLVFIQERLNKFKFQNVFLVGIIINMASIVWLITAPEANWMWVAIYIMLDACAFAMILPRLDTLCANAIDPKERARIRGLFNMVVLGISSPFGYVAGLLSDMDRRLPFVLGLGLLMIMAVVAMMGNRDKNAA